MNKIKCEHPVLIFAPNLVYNFCVKAVKAVLFDHIVERLGRGLYYNFPWSDFYVARNRVNVDNIDDCYLVDSDGCTYPVFMFVPCGKCLLCRSLKCEEWITRCVAESACSRFRPLFVTLTYRPDCRPDNMVDCKVDFQKFLKRLRINVERRFKVDGGLRYFAVSEWTPKNHYPHVHMLLWNMPFVSDGKLIDFIQNDCWQNGICRVEVARDCSGKYCTKYMKKGDDTDCWLLSSRRNGIGYEFAISMLGKVMKNPDITSVSIPVSDGSVMVRPIPSYFRRIWFPTLSNLFPSSVLVGAKEFLASATHLSYALNCLYGYVPLIDKIAQMVGCVTEKYGQFLKVDFNDATPSLSFVRKAKVYASLRQSSKEYIHYNGRDRVDTIDYVFDGFGNLLELLPSCFFVDNERSVNIPSRVSLNTPDCVDFRLILRDLYHTLRMRFKVLVSHDFDPDYIMTRLSCTEARKASLLALPDTPVDVKSCLAKVESDRRWIELHWMQNPNT